MILYKEINVQERSGLNMKKAIVAFRFYEISNFYEKRAVLLQVPRNSSF